MHHNRIWSALTVIGQGATCALLLLAGLASPIGQSDALAASCYGSNCTGYYAPSKGCATGANTGLWGEFPDGSFVEQRYSSVCSAEWERTTNDATSSQYAGGSILYPLPNWTNAQVIQSGGKINPGQTVYTPMVGPRSTRTSSCGDVHPSSPIQLPVTVHCLAE